jgi:leucyl aminopeptidase (aminopeptidase T)
MKQQSVFLTGMTALALTFVLTLAACGSSPEGYSTGRSAPDTLPVRKTSRSVPDFVRDAMRNVPEDALVGIGSSDVVKVNLAKQFAEAEARASLANQLTGIANNMVNLHGEATGNDPGAVATYGETVIQTLASSRLTGASPVGGDFDSNGTYWSVVQMPKDQAAKEINQASNQALTAAKLKAPRTDMQAALECMNKAIAANSESEVAAAAREESPVTTR